MQMTNLTRTSFSACMALLILAMLLIGCDTQANLIQGVSVIPPIPEINTPVAVTVNGIGRCTEMEIDWGDGSRTVGAVNLSPGPTYTHTYKEIGGGKTVTVLGTIGCEGRVVTRFNMEPAVFALALSQVQSPTAQTCSVVPNFPSVRSHYLIHITTVPASGNNGINFGCSPLRSCTYDADGRPGSISDSRFPFPGLREYSLVVRVSSQVVQGGTNMSFTTTDAGSLEVCLNDDDITNNTGGYQINISVDQLGPTPMPTVAGP
jgi:hypothetical protein